MILHFIQSSLTKYYRNKSKPAPKTLITSIPCKGVPPATLEPWPNDDYRREVALHVLTLHGRDISQTERDTCERYSNLSHAKGLDQDRMDRIVNTYGHEL